MSNSQKMAQILLFSYEKQLSGVSGEPEKVTLQRIEKVNMIKLFSVCFDLRAVQVMNKAPSLQEQ